MIKFFDSYGYFVDCIKKFEKFLVQCGNCGFIWMNPQVDYKNALTEEDFILLQMTLVDLNNWCPDVSELSEAGIEISHGACALCAREKLKKFVRKTQQTEGNPDCYGRANDGDCDRFDCKWRHTHFCVVKRGDYDVWSRRIRLLMEVVPLQICPES